MSSAGTQNPQLRRLCNQVGHRTSQCPELSDHEGSYCDLTVENLKQKEQEEAQKGRKEALRSMEVEIGNPVTAAAKAKGRGKGQRNEQQYGTTFEGLDATEGQEGILRHGPRRSWEK